MAESEANREQQLAARRARYAANPKIREVNAKSKAARKATHPEKLAYQIHRDNAKRRNIPFLLTYIEWWDIWQASGKWEQRGLGSDQYCMARHGDTGVYEVGNVRICTGRENRTEARKGKALSEAHRIALSKAWEKRRQRRPP